MNQTASCPSSAVAEPGLVGTILQSNRETEIAHWVSRACALNDEIKKRAEALGQVKARLLELPPGQYKSSGGRRVTVVGASTAVKPGEPQVTAARKLAGALAGRLFTRHVVFKPVGGLRDIARALLSPKRAERFIALCEVPTEPQLRF